MNIGIFGGAFDPVHNGHLALGECAVQMYDLDAFFFVPCADSPHTHKSVRLAAEHRLAMLKLAVADRPSLSVSEIELKRGGISYTVDTLNEFEDLFPDAFIRLFIGSDNYPSFSTWRRYKEILQKAHVTVIVRDDFAPELAEGFEFMPMPQIALSSSQIRGEVAAGTDVSGFVPPSVAAYIRQHGLYR
jgi:nicotinate-nucleotide adenylyltransferase